MNVSQIKAKITRAFRKYMAVSERKIFDAIPNSLKSGKLYEAYVLGLVAEELTKKEGYQLRLSAGTRLQLRASGGPIDREYPTVYVYRYGNKVAEIWTDIEFLTLSYRQRGSPATRTRGDLHELDIVMVPPALNDGYPSYDEIWLAVECKMTDYKKSFLKEILGVRRELSLLKPAVKTNFTIWPRVYVPADPPSCLLVYSTDEEVLQYSSPGDVFGINFYHKPL